MAVKTITIDMDAYNLLARDKGPKESFSQVIKRRLKPSHTANNLLNHLWEMTLAEETLDEIENLVEARKASMPRSPSLT